MPIETEKSIYIDAFQLCVCQIPKCSSPHTVLVVPQSSLCVIRKMRFLHFFIFRHKVRKHYQHMRVLHTPLWARGRFSDVQIPTFPIHISIPKVSDPLQGTRGFLGKKSPSENRIQPQIFEGTGPSSGSASLLCVRCGLLQSYSRSSYSQARPALDTPSII